MHSTTGGKAILGGTFNELMQNHFKSRNFFFQAFHLSDN